MTVLVPATVTGMVAVPDGKAFDAAYLAAGWSPPPRPLNSVAAIVASMRPRPPGSPVPHGVPTSYNWYNSPVLGDPKDGQREPLETGWGQVYAEQGQPEPTCPVEAKNFEVYLWSLAHAQWVRVQAQRTVDGALYAEDFAGNASVPANWATQPDGGEATLMQVGHNIHFWPHGGQASVPNPSDVGAVFVTYQARMVNPGPLDRVIANAGLDWWAANYSANPGCGESGWQPLPLDGSWAAINFYTGGPVVGSVAGAWTEAQLQANPPPLDGMGTP
jgi:hypothetical protein